MRIVAVSVGGPREIAWEDRIVETSIFKAPINGRLRVRWLNIEGDQQSDLTVHGGFDKAVYCYPAEHYAYWRDQLPGVELPWGSFGENLTTEGLLEEEVFIGDEYRIGTAEFSVTQPRMPCYKLGIRFGRADMVKLFHQSGRNGFYLRVTKEGEIGGGDAIELTSQDERGLTVANVVRLYTDREADGDLLKLASEHSALSVGWRDHFRKRLLQA